MNFHFVLENVIQKNDLSADDARELLALILRQEITDVQVASILTALRCKGESPQEILGFIQGMRACMNTVDAPDAVDIVGTGGDNSGTFNISTCAALVMAGAGVRIAKHGNRAASSKCGSADVLETLGVNIQMTPQTAQAVFHKCGIVFLWAPIYHSAMKHVSGVRREMGVRTIFNIIGPFANPAGTRRQLVGLANINIARKIALAANDLGYERLMLVSSDDGMDEASIVYPTTVIDINKGIITESKIEPSEYGMSGSINDLQGGDAKTNADIILNILNGQKGAKRDAVLLNAALGMLVAGNATSINDGISLAIDSIDSGKASQKLQCIISESRC